MKGIFVASMLALVIGLAGTPLWIRLVVRLGYGQIIREDGVATHLKKRGTPTMGGTVLVVAALLGYAAAHLITQTPPTISGVLVLFLMTGLGVVGFIDDYIKVFKQRSLGLRSRAKATGIVIIGAIFAIGCLHFPNSQQITPASPRLSFLRDFGPKSIGPYLFVLWALILIQATSNGVNLTDGLDGLASGASGMVLGAYVVIGQWQFRQGCASALGPHCYPTRDPLDLAIVAASVLGACFGFLWWNAPPARIFMGDTGSLALGGALVGLAITTHTQFLMAILAGLIVMITASVIIQVGYFKTATRLNLARRRVFKMAPLQHHFEMSGWAETTIVVRFWLMEGFFVAMGLGLFYLEWTPTG